MDTTTFHQEKKFHDFVNTKHQIGTTSGKHKYFCLVDIFPEKQNR